MFSKKATASELTGTLRHQPAPGEQGVAALRHQTVPHPVNDLAMDANLHCSDGIVIVGRGTRITGEITDCFRLEIQGVVEGTIVADALVIHAGGSVTGRLQANHAEVHGNFNGQLQIAELLDVRSTGRVEGELAYGKLAVAMGGHISGNVTTPEATHLLVSSEPSPSEQPAIAPNAAITPNYENRYGGMPTT